MMMTPTRRAFFFLYDSRSSKKYVIVLKVGLVDRSSNNSIYMKENKIEG
jgi:hypothetical protein